VKAVWANNRARKDDATMRLWWNIRVGSDGCIGGWVDMAYGVDGHLARLDVAHDRFFNSRVVLRCSGWCKVSAPVRNCYRVISYGAESREMLRGLTFSLLLCGERRGTLSAAMQRNESACRTLALVRCGTARPAETAQGARGDVHATKLVQRANLADTSEVGAARWRCDCVEVHA
jgi:hypothetical protein